MRASRLNATLVAMAGKVTISTQNFVNFGNILEPGIGVKIKQLLPAMNDVYFNRRETVEFIHDKSGEMTDRFQNIERDIRHNMEKNMSGFAKKSLGDRVNQWSRTYGFAMVVYTDQLTAYPAWRWFPKPGSGP